MLQPVTIRTVKSYQQDDQSECVNLIQIEDEISATFELLKVLHQYNGLNAWTLLIAPDHVPSKALLDSCAIDKSKLLVIRQKHLVNLEYVLNSALHNGNFAAVITWTDVVNNQQLTHLFLNLSKTSAKLYCFTKNTHIAAIPITQQAC
jgi:cell division inhibitor SulA